MVDTRPARISLREILAGLPETAVSRGSTYWRTNRVVSLELKSADDGLVHIAALVRGSAPAPYRVEATVDPDPSQPPPRVTGDCSCPVGTDCKHLAAALFAFVAAVRSSNRVARRTLFDGDDGNGSIDLTGPARLAGQHQI